MWKEVEKQSVTYRIADNEPTIIRIDGKNFSKLTKQYFKQPLDENFSKLMLDTALELIDWLQGTVLIFSQSDEFNVLLYPRRKQSQIAFGGKVQKIISLSAAKTSVVFTQKLGSEALFDARIILPRIYAELSGRPLEDSIIDYFKERFFNGVRNSRNTFARYYLGPSAMHKKTSKELIKLVKDETGNSWYDLPDIVKYGFVVYRTDDIYQKIPISVAELEGIVHDVLSYGPL